MAMRIHLYIVFGCFYAAVVDLNSRNKDRLVLNPEPLLSDPLCSQ